VATFSGSVSLDMKCSGQLDFIPLGLFSQKIVPERPVLNFTHHRTRIDDFEVSLPDPDGILPSMVETLLLASFQFSAKIRRKDCPGKLEPPTGFEPSATSERVPPSAPLGFQGVS
jgi:hypothetical protein